MNEKHLKLSPFSKMRFLEWVYTAIALNSLKSRLHFNEGEVWNCHLGMNIGDEEMGKSTSEEYLRPVIILKKFSKKLCLVVPLTSTLKNAPYSYKFIFRDKQSLAMLTQIRSIDASRLHSFMGKMKVKDYRELMKKLMTFLS